MAKIDEKYNKTIGILKKSKPVLESGDEISREVIRRISSYNEPDQPAFSIIDLLFGWTDIVWIRRSLITVSILLISLFFYQQSMIVKQLNWLNSQIVINQDSPVNTIQSVMLGRMKFMKITGSRIQQKSSTITEDQIDMLIESIDKIQTEYDNLMKIILEDPELKEMIDKKLKEMNYTKVKL